MIVLVYWKVKACVCAGANSQPIYGKLHLFRPFPCAVQALRPVYVTVIIKALPYNKYGTVEWNDDLAQ